MHAASAMHTSLRRLWEKVSGSSAQLSTEGSPAKPKEVYNKANIELLRTVGTGSFGRVFVARLKDGSDDLIAVKRLTKAALIKLKQVEHIKAERAILGAIKHPFCVKAHNTFKDSYYLYIVLEFIQGGEFFTYLRRCKSLRSFDAKFYASQVTLIFEYLHANSIIYRDLKPENLLINLDGYLKMTDFGFAKHVPIRTYTLCGTPEYMAPEVILNKGHGKAVDWWTLGILIYEMLAGFPPFYDEEVMQIYQKILDGKILFPQGFDRDARSLVKHLLQHDLSRRYGNLRNGAADVKDHRWFTGLDFTAIFQKRLNAPYRPTLKDTNDTSKFQKYEEARELPEPVTADKDPFDDW